MSNATLKIQPSQLVSISDTNITTTSLMIAEVFGKKHRDVLEAIRNIDCSSDFRVAEFSAYPYTHPQNKQTYTAYNITKDGFMFLVMGFTGAKAAVWKEAFINAFNAMEKQINHIVNPQPQTAAPITVTQQRQVEDAMQCITRYFKNNGQKASSNIHKVMRQRHGYSNLRSLNQTQLPRVLVDLKEIEILSHQAWQITSSLEKQFLHWLENQPKEQVTQLLITQKTALGLLSS